MTRFSSLGVITDKPIPDKKGIEELIDRLSSAFESKHCTKEKIVAIISQYLPNFEHIETGKTLDEKM